MELSNKLGLEGLEFQRGEERISKQKAKRLYDEKALALGARIIEPPAKRPWGAVNMSFHDPDNNVIYLRSFPKNSEGSKDQKEEI
ncbi:MAG: hypothetical protein IKQ41_02125 [Clostridia bacterium]|nr:hypothetical protein [Clostridia bacterium]